MSKLTMLKGLPASGKSTKAAEILKTTPNTVRLNRDLLREMLHCNQWTPQNEKVTSLAQQKLAKEMLNLGHDVIIDDTNLGEFHKNSWRSVATICDAEFEMIDLTPNPVPNYYLSDLIDRDNEREKSVGAHVIKSMALQYELYKPAKGWVICDIDGTLSDNSWRVHLIESSPKKWDEFFDSSCADPVIENTKEQIRTLVAAGYDLVFLTARPERTRVATSRWLFDNFVVDREPNSGYVIQQYLYFALLMRPNNDRRPHTEMKRSLFNKYFSDMHQIHKVFEDDAGVVDMYREFGLDVEHVKNV